MIVDIVDEYCTNDNNPIKNLRLNNISRTTTELTSLITHILNNEERQQDNH